MKLKLLPVFLILSMTLACYSGYSQDNDGEEILVPAVEPLIHNIDLAEELIIIDPIDGLLSINEN